MSDAPGGGEAPGSLRLDRWLWQTRFFKTRSLAAKLISAGRVRVNAAPVRKPAHPVRPGDTLTFPQGDGVRVIRATGLPQRRGPASEARHHYEDLEPPQAARPAAEGRPARAAGRPSSRERQAGRARREGIPGDPGR